MEQQAHTPDKACRPAAAPTAMKNSYCDFSLNIVAELGSAGLHAPLDR
jgi:hypothetical protein